MQIAVLGPAGTFTERAANRYMEKLNINGELSYYKTLKKTFEAIGNECKYGVIPIENTLDGFVQIILDQLATTELKIIHEIIMPIRFGFLSKATSLDDVTSIYAQFKTNNQCLDFLESNSHIDVITTASNSASYNILLDSTSLIGAIVPMHVIEELSFEERQNFPLIIENIADSLENETRFIVVSKDLNKEVNLDKGWKTLFMIEDDSDRPGLLAGILGIFAQANINLKSIISRPTKTKLGNYHFFIDIAGCYQRNEQVKKALEEATNLYKIRVLGSYYRVG